jgi:hypothetical protein
VQNRRQRIIGTRSADGLFEQLGNVPLSSFFDHGHQPAVAGHNKKRADAPDSGL